MVKLYLRFPSAPFSASEANDTSVAAVASGSVDARAGIGEVRTNNAPAIKHRRREEDRLRLALKEFALVDSKLVKQFIRLQKLNPARK